MTSKVKVDNINKVSDDTTIIKKCGSTTTVGSGSGNTIVVCGSTVTIGRCGGTVALASGATQTGFGSAGQIIDWQTGSIKTTTFTATSGEGYFVDTSSGAVTANLPSGTAGSVVAFADYTRTFQTHALTINPNGSQKIGGVAQDAFLTVEGQSATFVYVDDTEGWINVLNAEVTEKGEPPFISATGGSETTVCTNFKVHTFTGPGTFTVTDGGTPAGANTVDYLVIGGGGSGGACGSGAGGGGAGGYRFSAGTASGCYTAGPSPLAATAIPVTPGTSYPITVGAGGAGTAPPNSNPGSNSVFSTITAAGGGGGAMGPGGPGTGKDGGSGGGGVGGRGCSPCSAQGGTGNTPSVSPPQGFDGGDGTPGSSSQDSGGGGGGSSAAGGNGSPGAGSGGAGGDGLVSCITASPVQRGGGGGGAVRAGDGQPPTRPVGPGGAGGGGNGGRGKPNPTHSTPPSLPQSGTANTGGGAGGAGKSQFAGAGGSGIVIIRYKFQ